jgi:DNA-binding FrmR family transcriptional regulator
MPSIEPVVMPVMPPFSDGEGDWDGMSAFGGIAMPGMLPWSSCANAVAGEPAAISKAAARRGTRTLKALVSGSGATILYPQGVYKMKAMKTKHASAQLITRLTRIEGQVRGVARMVEEDRYCIDILNQIQAVKAALKKVEEQVLKDHAAHCVAHAIASGDTRDQTQKFSELVELFSRYGK